AAPQAHERRGGLVIRRVSGAYVEIAHCAAEVPGIPGALIFPRLALTNEMDDVRLKLAGKPPMGV
ncbi:hypothetical protein ACKI1Z_43680, partial [Streptomyces galilaeus]|uniref:hypothetical protein n=1 Tax=Streptomyces galilaeus TaxID=33899 RepID=UPI0038F5FA91